MKKQPYLTGFPRTVFATAKRLLQARIRTQRAEIQSQSLSGYSVLFDSILPADFMQTIDRTRRQRSFGHLPTFWAWLSQILHANMLSVCCKAGMKAINCLSLPVILLVIVKHVNAWNYHFYKPFMSASPAIYHSNPPLHTNGTALISMRWTQVAFTCSTLLKISPFSLSHQANPQVAEHRSWGFVASSILVMVVGKHA